MFSHAPGRTQRMRRARLRVSIMAAVFAIAALVAVEFVSPVPSPAAAASGSTFQPGLIITDELFYDSGAMSATEIQTFLDTKIGTCQNSNCLNVARIPYPGRARDVSSTTGNLICDAIPAGTMRVSDLIFRTQVACGISAKVILVTLQKEQGLVLSKAPSDIALRWAMGMACPDTAPCDTAFAGLGTQIVAGTRQLKAYKAAAFGRQPGTQFVQWNPDYSCGGTYVNVQNYATAALYNYTPYQPNSAALNNLYGLGDGCSSYGNRNFFAFYTDWFGPTTGGGKEAIAELYASAGVATSLGAGVAYLDCPSLSTRCWPKYERGSIYWSGATGADIVLGAKDAAYRALGGPDSPIGYPITGEYSYTQNGGGSAQVFENGSLFQSAAGIFPTYGGVKTAYFAKQGAWGDLGWPTSNVQCDRTSCSQIFEHGAIAVVGGTSEYLTQEERDAWVGAGGMSGALGSPTAPLARYAQNGGGNARVFSGGTIFASAAGTYAVTDPIRTGYFAQQGAWGPLGWPASAAQCSANGCSQKFQNGAVVTNGTASYSFTTPEYDTYVANGGPSGALGPPTSAQVVYTQNGGGYARSFANGSLFQSSSGTFAVTDPIRAAYFAQQGAWGALGWPTSAMTCANGTCSQSFQGGTLSSGGTTPPGSGTSTEALAVYMGRVAAVATQYKLGAPTSDMLVYTENGGGVARVYGSTTVFSSEAGAFRVSNSVRTTYFATRGAWGDFGWPVAEQQCASSSCWQRFQNGAIFSTGYTMPTAEFDAYQALGGPTGILGMPTSTLLTYTQNGGGTARVFMRGSIFTSAAGAFVVTDPVRTAYFAKQGAWGDLGWPSSAATKSGTTSVQMFQGGAVAVVGGKAQYLSSAERDVWTSAGGPTGALGVPSSDQLTYTQNGGGTARVYTGGSIFASAPGTFAITDPIRTAYFAKQGAWGDLGWPTAAATTENGVTIQAFQHGMVVVDGGGTANYLGTAERDLWISLGGVSGSLGVPVVPARYSENGGGTALAFTQGAIYTSAAGTFAVTEPVRTVYFASQGARGTYGWPTSAMTCASGTCTQVFQGGTISTAGG